jgi:hemerythrin
MARTWSPKLAIHVPAIDAQHQELFQRADDLLDATRGGKGAEEVKRLLDYLEQYVAVHFGAEERLMRARRYPELAAHQRLHEEFRREFQSVKEQATRQATASSATLRLNALIGSWLVHHIGTVDVKLAASLGDQAARLQL